MALTRGEYDALSDDDKRRILYDEYAGVLRRPFDIEDGDVERQPIADYRFHLTTDDDHHREWIGYEPDHWVAPPDERDED